MIQLTFPGGRFEARATTVKYLIEWAYGIVPAQHNSLPSWMEEERFDILAKAAGPASDDEMKRMTQKMLASRFHLALHRETREVPLLILLQGKTAPKLYPAKEEEKRSIKMVPQMGPDEKVGSYRVVATRFSFATLNDVFSRQLGRVIVNQTGLEGDFDFTLDFPRDESNPNPLDATHIIDAIRDQLGLAIKSQKGPSDFLVIDGGEKPTAN
jgi:uncharacterized protein (TIGR03435 family)